MDSFNILSNHEGTGAWIDQPHGGFNAATTDKLWNLIAKAEEPDPTLMEEMYRARNRAEWMVGLELEATK